MSVHNKHLAKLGIARETTGHNYGRIYAYDKYHGDILMEFRHLRLRKYCVVFVKSWV